MKSGFIGQSGLMLWKEQKEEHASAQNRSYFMSNQRIYYNFCLINLAIISNKLFLSFFLFFFGSCDGRKSVCHEWLKAFSDSSSVNAYGKGGNLPEWNAHKYQGSLSRWMENEEVHAGKSGPQIRRPAFGRSDFHINLWIANTRADVVSF